MNERLDATMRESDDLPELDPLDLEAPAGAPDQLERPADAERLPLPSEDGGDLAAEPPSGETDDHLVATEEAVPYVPPTERVLSEPRLHEAGADVAGTAPTDAGELERADMIQPPTGAAPRDDELRGDVIEALRASDLIAGDRLAVAVDGDRVTVRGELDSIDLLNEVLGLVGDVPGVGEVVDEVRVAGL